MTTADTAAGTDLELVKTTAGWEFRHKANERHTELIYEIEDRLGSDEISYREAAERLDAVLGANRDWLEGRMLRGVVADLGHEPELGQSHCQAAYKAGLGKIREAKADQIPWSTNSNRGFLRAADGYAEGLVAKGAFGEAAQVLRGMLEWNPDDDQGARFMLGPVLLRTGKGDEAIAQLRDTADENPACRYELGLALFEQERFIEAATALRRAVIENPYLAQTLGGIRVPEPQAIWSPTNLHDHRGARDYMHQWAERWGANPEARDFLHWLRTHPEVMAEQARILGPFEELSWETNPDKRKELKELAAERIAGIGDTLSSRIVHIRYNGRETPDYPWRVIRAQRKRINEMSRHI